LWGEDKGVVWLATCNISKYLGFPIKYNMLQKEKDNEIFQLVQGKLIVCIFKNLSLVTRILVANQVILVFVWYVTSCVDLSLFVVKKMKTLIMNFCLVRPSNWESKGKGCMGHNNIAFIQEGD
jgi:hypothetical protein